MTFMTINLKSGDRNTLVDDRICQTKKKKMENIFSICWISLIKLKWVVSDTGIVGFQVELEQETVGGKAWCLQRAAAPTYAAPHSIDSSLQ